MERMAGKKPGFQQMMQVISGLGMIGCAVLVIAGWKAGLFTSAEKMSEFVSGFGKAGILVFIAFQAVQVVVPVLPGNLGCLAGVMMYGAGWGFVYNYIGICLGSMAAFGIAKMYGRPLIDRLFSEKLIAKYENNNLLKERKK